MEGLIKVSVSNIGGQEVNSVNLRDVWTFVESKRPFSEWKISRLKRAVQGVDFTELHEHDAVKTATYGQGRIDFIVTLDLAKSICMLEDNEKGDILRQYFIDCEKKLLAQSKLPSNYIEALKALVESEEAKQKALAQAVYQDRALTTSQINNGKLTRKNKLLEAKLRGFDGYCSITAYLSRNKISCRHPQTGYIHTPSIVTKLKKLGMENEEWALKTFSGDEYPTTIFEPEFLDEQRDFIESEIQRLIQQKLKDLPKTS